MSRFLTKVTAIVEIIYSAPQARSVKEAAFAAGQALKHDLALFHLNDDPVVAVALLPDAVPTKSLPAPTPGQAMTAGTLEQHPHPALSRERWREAVAAADTELGYWAWAAETYGMFVEPSERRVSEINDISVGAMGLSAELKEPPQPEPSKKVIDLADLLIKRASARQGG